MATANEIFATTTEEPHIVVGSDRKIKVPDSLKRLGVQFDHNIETVTFDCPRYWDDHDMSEMAVYINYMLSNGYSDSYPADNVKADGDTMHFTWTISQNVTQVAGSINFLVCVKNTDGNGKEINHWNSELCQDAYISKGMENEEIPVLEQSDLITSLLLRMDSVEKINIKADAMQTLFEETQAVAATAEQIKEEALDASDYIKNNYANSIKGNVSGEVIRVDDVSPIQHTINTKVHGKNLWNNDVFQVANPNNSMYISSVTSSSITLTSVEGYVGNGHHPTAITLRQVCPQMKANKTYVLQADSVSNIQSIYLAEEKQYWNFNQTLLITEELLDCTIGLYGLSSMRDQGYGDCIISNIQIEEGAVATEYEPYIDPTSVTVTGCGKNLFLSFEEQKANGVTLRKVSDYYILNGTATQEGLFQKMGALQSGRYTLSANNPIHNGIELAIVQVYSPTIGELNIAHDNIANSKITVDIKGATDYYFRIRYEKGITYNNYIVKPQLELGETATDYEPYKGETYTPNQNGDVEVTSVTPTTTIFTDTPGVTIDAEYNRDTNYVIGGIKDDALTYITTLQSGTTNLWELQSGLYRVPSYVTVKANTNETLPKPTKSYSYLYVSGKSYSSTEKRYIVGWAYMVSTLYDNRYASKIFTGATHTDTGSARDVSTELATMAKLKAYVDSAIGGIENGSY